LSVVGSPESVLTGKPKYVAEVPVARPDIMMLPVPAFKAKVDAPVLLPMVIFFALALLPMLIAPVVVESKVKALVVVELIVPAPAKVRAVAEVPIVQLKLRL